MKYRIIALALCVATGCTTLSLERHTVAQVDSVAELRSHIILDNLALVAEDPTRLPSFVGLGSGTVFVADQGQMVVTTTWPFSNVGKGTGSVVSNGSVNRQISQNWALDPVMIPEKLEALRAACQWAIGGPGYVNPESVSLLIDPKDANPGPERHFGVLEQLSKLPPDWLGRGCPADVPACARYKSHSGDTWVWVTPDNEKYLVVFTLALQNIAKVNVNSPTLFHLPPVFAPIVLKTADTGNPEGPMRFTTQMVLDQSGHLVPDQPYFIWRLDNSFSDPALRSAIGAAGISSVSH
jgi:hypothetical protein